MYINHTSYLPAKDDSKLLLYWFYWLTAIGSTPESDETNEKIYFHFNLSHLGHKLMITQFCRAQRLDVNFS